jgi:hypothetical protein
VSLDGYSVRSTSETKKKPRPRKNVVARIIRRAFIAKKSIHKQQFLSVRTAGEAQIDRMGRGSINGAANYYSEAKECEGLGPRKAILTNVRL